MNIDSQSERSLQQLTEKQKVLSQRFSGVKSVLIILSAKGMVFDRDALKQKVSVAYPEAQIFFQAPLGRAVGEPRPAKVDLLIDLTGPGQREGWFAAKRLKKIAKYCVGRNVGWFRKKIYDRVFDELSASDVPHETLAKERVVQKKVLSMAGVPLVQVGEVPVDRGKTIPLDLPPMKRLQP